MIRAAQIVLSLPYCSQPSGCIHSETTTHVSFGVTSQTEKLPKRAPRFETSSLSVSRRKQGFRGQPERSLREHDAGKHDRCLTHGGYKRGKERRCGLPNAVACCSFPVRSHRQIARVQVNRNEDRQSFR